MIDIIIVTHGEYGKAMLASSELIMGEQENVQAFGFYLGESVEHLRGLYFAGNQLYAEGK